MENNLLPLRDLGLVEMFRALLHISNEMNWVVFPYFVRLKEFLNLYWVRQFSVYRISDLLRTCEIYFQRTDLYWGLIYQS